MARNRALVGTRRARRAAGGVFSCCLAVVLFLLTGSSEGRGALLWSDLGATLVHETGPGVDILGGTLERTESARDTLYFKFHVDPVSDSTTEEYFAAFQLFERGQERLAVGNALKAWGYSAFMTGQNSATNQAFAYIDLNSSKPDYRNYELPHWGIERTIVFKIQYRPGASALVTVWLDPDLRTGATEASQMEALTTRFEANGSFDQIRLRHSGGGGGWVFSEMAIATSFDDLVNANDSVMGGEAPFTFRSWQREQGLVENYVRAVAQTRDGCIWVGSDEGVSRFDGLNFFALGVREGFQSQPIRVLYGDSRGALWIGSVDSGLSCWQDGRLRKFGAREGLPSDSITALVEDSQQRLWVGTQAGLVVRQGERLAPLAGAERLAGKAITGLGRGAQGAMWVSAAGEGVFCWTGDRLVALRDSAQDNLLQDAHCLLVDHRGRLWVGAGDSYVLCLEEGRWQRFGMPRHLATHQIKALVEAPEETIWAGSAGDGLFEFKAGKLVAINASQGLSDTMVEALLVDREGKLWVGTHGGLNRLCTRNFSVLSHKEGLGYGAVQGLAEVRPGEVWASKLKEGVYRWDGQRFSRLMLVGLSLREPGVNTLLAARDGSCWVGGDFGLLHFQNPQTADKEAGELALTQQNIRALAEDPATGEIWAGSTKGELWHWREGHWRNQTNFASGHAVTSIVAEPARGLWVGTEGDGLYWVERGGLEKCERVGGLPSSWIRTLHLNTQATLWIGTGGGGLCRLRQGEVAVFTKREGLPDNTISQIQEDADEHLWLGGNSGIVRVGKQDLDDLAARRIPAVYPQIYGRADGMLSEECVSGFSPAGLKTQAGLLWFLTLKGIVVVDPRRMQSAPAPVLALERTLVDGVAGTAAAGAELTVAPGKHTLEFHYLGLSFDAPERVRFRYQLVGLDPNWVEAGTRRTALYSFVPPGHYIFRVIACNGDGVWNEAGASLDVIMQPHFWQTWWFVATATLGGLAVGGGGVRMVVRRRLQQRLKRLEQDRALERERTRIAQDLHDLMGAKLCRISFMSEHARRDPTMPAEFKEHIRSMSNDSRDVLRSLDEIVWAVNPENDTLEHLVTYIEQYSQEYFRRTGIECEVEIPSQLPARPLTSQSRHHLFLAVHEALANALKHSNATRVRVAMARHGDDFAIAVSDNGQGFDPGASEASAHRSAAGFGNGLGNMRRRLAELGGRVELESRPGQGATVRFVLSLKDVVS